MKITDITRGVMTTPVYPGDPEPVLSDFSSIEFGGVCNMKKLTSVLHCGTHADSPRHFIKGGAAIEDVPLDLFIGECAVIEIPCRCITEEAVREYFPEGEERVLVKSPGGAYFDRGGAEALKKTGVRLIGVDSCSVGCEADQKGPHTAILGAGIGVLENLDLSAAAPGRYFLCAPPVKIEGADGSFVRACLIG